MANMVLISVTGHLVTAGIYNDLLSLSFLHSLCHQQAPQQVGDPTFIPETSGSLAILPGLGSYHFPLTKPTGHVPTKRHLRGSHILDISFLISITEEWSSLPLKG